jgi:hypothetical protein
VIKNDNFDKLGETRSLFTSRRPSDFCRPISPTVSGYEEVEVIVSFTLIGFIGGMCSWKEQGKCDGQSTTLPRGIDTICR